MTFASNNFLLKFQCICASVLNNSLGLLYKLLLYDDLYH
jgi:hypothetical protein